MYIIINNPHTIIPIYRKTINTSLKPFAILMSTLEPDIPIKLNV